ncbi:hypothetical protein NDU88_000590 [Pleurodeles waltl]|uniref:G-protein coupled receptors family 1 profile domain-containing protein n=1 Tax=Pleurodeles waltl TaxID=8319 RepID=A0AAV7SWY0_PLEWA|nr:hypothetical protein NDU88_000590 [Pleurodeles waltl]
MRPPGKTCIDSIVHQGSPALILEKVSLIHCKPAYCGKATMSQGRGESPYRHHCLWGTGNIACGVQASLPIIHNFSLESGDEDDYNYLDAMSYNPHDNETYCEYSYWTPTHVLMPTIYTLIFLLGISGNGLVLWTIYHKPEKRRSVDTFIASLALADLAFVVTLPLWAVSIALDYHWPFGSLACKLSSYLTSLNIYASIFCLTCLSFDRYLAIVHSLTNGQLRSWISGLRATVVLWVLAAVLSLPRLVFCRTGPVVEQAEKTKCFMDFAGIAGEAAALYWMTSLSILTTLLGFVAPFAVMLTCYVFIGRTISSHFQKQRHEVLRKQRLLSIITSLVICFAACWLPYHLVKITYLLMDLEVLPWPCSFQAFLSNISPYTTCLAYVNSCLNPFLYAFFDSRFREQCQAVLSCGRLRLVPGRGFLRYVGNRELPQF